MQKLCGKAAKSAARTDWRARQSLAFRGHPFASFWERERTAQSAAEASKWRRGVQRRLRVRCACSRSAFHTVFPIIGLLCRVAEMGVHKARIYVISLPLEPLGNGRLLYLRFQAFAKFHPGSRTAGFGHAIGLLPGRRFIGDAGWSSPVARQAHNLKVVSSNLAPATNLTCKAFSSAIVRRLLAGWPSNAIGYEKSFYGAVISA